MLHIHTPTCIYYVQYPEGCNYTNYTRYIDESEPVLYIIVSFDIIDCDDMIYIYMCIYECVCIYIYDPCCTVYRCFTKCDDLIVGWVDKYYQQPQVPL